MNAAATSLRHLQNLLRESDSDRRSELALDRLLARANDHGFECWILTPNRLDRGFTVLLDGTFGTFLPTNEPIAVANAFAGTVVGSAADWLPLVRLKFPEITLDYVPTSVFEGMLIETIKRRSG